MKLRKLVESTLIRHAVLLNGEPHEEVDEFKYQVSSAGVFRNKINLARLAPPCLHSFLQIKLVLSGLMRSKNYYEKPSGCYVKGSCGGEFLCGAFGHGVKYLCVQGQGLSDNDAFDSAQRFRNMANVCHLRKDT